MKSMVTLTDQFLLWYLFRCCFTLGACILIYSGIGNRVPPFGKELFTRLNVCSPCDPLQKHVRAMCNNF